MRTLDVFRVPFAVVLATGVMFAAGCSRNTGVALGPKPASYATANAAKQQFVDNMRAWLSNLGPSDAKTLANTGQVTFAFEELRSSDPAHAQMIEQYMNQLRSRSLAKAQAKGFVLPQISIQGASFQAVHDAAGKAARGAYALVINLQNGVANIPLSDHF